MKTTTAIITIFILLFSCSIVSARHTQTPKDSWQQEFASEAQEKGLEEAIKSAREEGKNVTEIVEASIAAGYGDYVIVISLVNVGTEKTEIIAAAEDNGLNQQIVVSALAEGGTPAPDGENQVGFTDQDPAPGPPVTPIVGGTAISPGASPSTF